MNTATKILVVDDDPDFLDSTRTILEAASYDVAVAASPEEALAQMEGEKPDLLILDVMMSEWDSGFKLLWKLRARPSGGTIPVLMITGVDKQMGVDFARHACTGLPEDEEYLPVDGYLEKPVTAALLLKNVGWALRNSGRRAPCS